LGFLIEEQRTNLFTYSEQFDNAVWNKTNATTTANTIVAPDGTLTGDKFIATTTSAVHVIRQTITVTASAHTQTIYAKAGEYSFITISMDGNNFVYFNLANGTLGNIGTDHTASIYSAGNGWYRCSATQTFPSPVSKAVFFNIASANGTVSFSGNGFDGVYIWDAQLEAGAFATSYIPTVASQVTRAADAASMTGTNFSSWFNNAEGTITVAGTRKSPPTAGKFPYAAHLISTANSGIDLYQNGATSEQTLVRVANVSQATLNNTVVAANVPFILAAAYKTDDFAACVSAGTVLTDTAGTVPVMSSLFIGSFSSSGFEFNGTIKKLSYYPLRLSNTNLQAITG
jgi:hypothetical protein